MLPLLNRMHQHIPLSSFAGTINTILEQKNSPRLTYWGFIGVYFVTWRSAD